MVLPDEFTRIPDALIRFHKRTHPPDIVDAAGAPVVDAALHRQGVTYYSEFVDRRAPVPADHLAGNWLFAGDYWTHFGHFLFESLARLWAYPALRDQIDGVVFLDPRGSGVVSDDRFQRQLLNLLGVDLPVRLLAASTTIDRLIVPRAGCGMGPLSPGIPAFRRFIQGALRQVPARTDADRVYISRSGYGLRRGGILGEDHLETALAAEGYLIWSPEAATLEDQIATYLGARQIIGPDSSALHLFGFLGTSAQDLAIVLRRPDGARDMLPQITGFTGRAPLIIDAIVQMRLRDNARTPAWAQVAELDFARVSQGLAAAGFVSSADAIPALTRRKTRMLWEKAARRMKCSFADA